LLSQKATVSCPIALNPTRFLPVIIGSNSGRALLAQISIPLPFTPVPITGQTFAVLLTGALLGSRLGVAAMLTYVAEGSAGLPFFAGGAHGPAVLAGPTGGYLVGFVIAAFVVHQRVLFPLRLLRLLQGQAR